MSKKTTYFTKKDMKSWGNYLHSDGRRLKKQKEAFQKQQQKIQQFIPWSIAERMVTDQDFEDWKQIRELEKASEATQKQ